MPRKDQSALQQEKDVLKKKLSGLRSEKSAKLKAFRKAKKRLRRVGRKLKLMKGPAKPEQAAAAPAEGAST